MDPEMVQKLLQLFRLFHSLSQRSFTNFWEKLPMMLIDDGGSQKYIIYNVLKFSPFNWT